MRRKRMNQITIVRMSILLKMSSKAMFAWRCLRSMQEAIEHLYKLVLL